MSNMYEDPIYDEVGTSYDSNIPSEVQDHDYYSDNVDEYHQVHKMQSNVQHNYVVNSYVDYTSDSNIILYDQYMKDNEEHVVQSNVSFVRNDALMSIIDDMHEQGVQSMSANKQVKVVNDTLTSKLVRYKELVGVYEKWTKFELTEREQKIDEQMMMERSSNQLMIRVQDGRVVVQDVRGRYIMNNQGRPFQRNNARGHAGGQNRVGNVNPGQAKTIKCYNCNGWAHSRECETGHTFDDDVDDPPEQDLALNVDHVFEADQLDAFDSDVDEAPTTHTMFMANLTFKDPIFNEAETSYDPDIPFEVQDHDNYHDSVYGHHDVHGMQNNIQQDYVVDSEADYMSDSNIISYDQYVEDNTKHVVQCNVSYVQNDALRSIIDEMHEEGVQSRIVNKQDKVVKDSLNSELTRYKELVGEYKKWAMFELTEREQKIDKQMIIIISDRNRKETSLKSELHTVQMNSRLS
ncbi:hypothetical protein Tco_0992477 [Tanacetum coccineum]|uniref:CCHC-type domain-containing protein n=1 Tax=Tanacetum coccineum TaxID=301880 RepID=A0ABQ5F2Y3_9ASTR